MLFRWVPAVLTLWLALLVACAGNAAPEADTETSNEQAEAAIAEEPGMETAVPEFPSEEEAADAPQENESKPADSAGGEPEEVVIIVSDGLALHGTFYPTGGSAPGPAVLLLHMLGSSRETWEQAGAAAGMNRAGFAVLAIDLRGHGETGGEIDWPAAELDLQAVWRYLADREEVDEARVALVGASIGANLALRVGANEPAVPAAALLSPGLDYRGVTTEDALSAFGQRPLLIVASSEDRYAADSSRTLVEQAGENARLVIVDDAGHGTNMLTRRPELIDVLIAWLKEQV